jgi:Domain of unknown function (DUF1905)
MKYHVHVRETLHIFSGRIYKVGLIRYVDVPKEITRKLATGKPHVPVRGTVEGVFLRTTMVSRGKGCHRVAIHGDIRKRLRVDAGAVVDFPGLVCVLGGRIYGRRSAKTSIFPHSAANTAVRM